MTIKFLLQSQKNPANIYVRMSMGRDKVIKRKTGFVVDPKKFKVDMRLRELQNKIERAYNLAVENNVTIDGDWLDGVLSGVQDKNTVQDHIDKILKEAHSRPNAKGGTGLSEGRIKIYITFQGVLDRFHPDLPFGAVNMAMVEKFKTWLFKEGYSVNYVGKNVELLKTVCRDAERKGAKLNKELYLVKTLKEKIMPVILTPEEQDKIKGLTLDRASLINARKWLLLGCQIGQRGSDLLSLSEDDIKRIGDLDAFEVVQFKTGKMVYVPLTPQAKEVIKDGFPYPIALQKMNNHLKELAELARIEKKLTTHVCRRSFATNFYGRIPTSVLMGITGHSTEEMFLRYIGKTSLDNALEFARYF